MEWAFMKVCRLSSLLSVAKYFPLVVAGKTGLDEVAPRQAPVVTYVLDFTSNTLLHLHPPFMRIIPTYQHERLSGIS
jgi:hypothetical protein